MIDTNIKKENLFYEKLQQLAKQRGKSFNSIEREIGYSRNALNNYKNGIEPSASRLLELADYFKVPPEYFFSNIESPCSTNTNLLFNQLSDREKFEMFKISQRWMENSFNQGPNI